VNTKNVLLEHLGETRVIFSSAHHPILLLRRLCKHKRMIKDRKKVNGNNHPVSEVL